MSGGGLLLGLVSDTHGHLHPGLSEALAGADAIIHGGDVGDARVLDFLAGIAPVVGVKGNYDDEPGLAARLLPDPSRIELAGRPFLLTHRMFTMGWDASKEALADALLLGEQVPFGVIFGHTHFAVMERIKGIWFLNPGYLGPDPYEGPHTIIRAELSEDGLTGEIVQLD